jgi:hypothetical protein
VGAARGKGGGQPTGPQGITSVLRSLRARMAGTTGASRSALPNEVGEDAKAFAVLRTTGDDEDTSEGDPTAARIIVELATPEDERSSRTFVAAAQLVTPPPPSPGAAAAAAAAVPAPGPGATEPPLSVRSSSGSIGEEGRSELSANIRKLGSLLPSAPDDLRVAAMNWVQTLGESLAPFTSRSTLDAEGVALTLWLATGVRGEIATRSRVPVQWDCRPELRITASVVDGDVVLVSRPPTSAN